MHNTNVRLKDGRTFSSPIYLWRPLEGWFSLFRLEESDPEKIWFRDVEEAVTENQRIRIDLIADRDELERARKDGWDGS